MGKNMEKPLKEEYYESQVLKGFVEEELVTYGAGLGL